MTGIVVKLYRMKEKLRKLEKSELSAILFAVTFLTLFMTVKRVTAADILSLETEVPLFLRFFFGNDFPDIYN